MSEPVKRLPKENLTGREFTYLTVLALIADNSRAQKWLCRCRCGKIVTKLGWRLLKRLEPSCGCYKPSKRQLAYTPEQKAAFPAEWEIWRRHRYKNRRKRMGVMCKLWRESFSAFIQSVGPRPPADERGPYYLLRLRTTEKYKPGNAFWGQSHQKKPASPPAMREYRGQMVRVRDWIKELGINQAEYWWLMKMPGTLDDLERVWRRHQLKRQRAKAGSTSQSESCAPNDAGREAGASTIS